MNAQEPKLVKLASLQRIPLAGYFAIKGLTALYQREAAFRQQVWAFLASTTALFFIPCTSWMRWAVLATSVLMLITEAINSALEAIIDYLAPQQHPEAGFIKDVGSAAVFLAVLFWMGTWGMVLWQTFMSNHFKQISP